MKTASEMIEEIKAEDELHKRGFTRSKCRLCEGFGTIGTISVLPGQFSHEHSCPSCNGTGKTGWRGPLVR